MEIAKKHVDYYHDRFNYLLTRETPKPEATEADIAKLEQKQLHNDSLFIQELNGFLFRDQGISREIKKAVIASIRTISTRSELEIEKLMKRSPEFADGHY
jgi:hypothetical protein